MRKQVNPCLCHWGGVAQCTRHPHREQKTRVRIPPVLRENIVMIPCVPN
jgi:hypothetical protein